MTQITEITIADPSVVVLIGPPGCGKSTFAQRHFAATEILNPDQYRAMICDDEGDQDASRGAFRVLDLILGERLAHGGAHLSVVDATNVNKKYRDKILAAARTRDLAVTAIVFDLVEGENLNWNAARERYVPTSVVTSFRERMESVTDEALLAEGFSTVYRIDPRADHNVNLVASGPNQRYADTGPFDIIGDVHGCFDELVKLLLGLGYRAQPDGVVVHPEGRRAMFVGDLVDRGPASDKVLSLVFDMWRAGSALLVKSNHDDKFARWLKGNKVKIGHGLGSTIAQLGGETRRELIAEQYLAWLQELPSHLVLDRGRLVVCHGGLPEKYHGRDSKKVTDLCMYGLTTNETDEHGYKVRIDWAAEYSGAAAVVHGHTVINGEPQWRNNVMCIDTGAVFGGALSALRWPEREVVSVPAAREYWPKH